MPPLVPRKRLRQTPPPDEKRSTKTNGSVVKPKPPVSAERRKATLFDDLDATSGSHASALLGNSNNDSDSSLTSLSSSEDEFEDVPLPKRQKNESGNGDEDEDEDEDMEFEDVAPPTASIPDGPAPSGDLELTLHRDTRVSLTNMYGDKKGPTKREKRVRHATHCVHVMTLLWHNAVRNAWLCDPEVQAIMISHLSPKLWEQVDRWRRNSGLEMPPPPKPKPRQKGKAKTKGRGKDKKPAAEDDHRDWGESAKHLEPGAVDMSHGDPLFRLMQYLAPWWRKRFRVEKPGLRKWGYMALERLDRLTKAHKAEMGQSDGKKAEQHDTEKPDPDSFGERIETLEDFRRAAQECRGSRDVGAQLFTALLRGLGLEARMIANLQVLGFGWNKLEDAEPEAEKKVDTETEKETNGKTPTKQTPKKSTANGKTPTKGTKASTTSSSNKKRRSTKSSINEPIVVDDSDDLAYDRTDTDDESVIELEVRSKRLPPPKKFDGDLEYPHYWTEVLSPVTKKYLPVEPVLKCVIATNRDLVESLEPRGAKADKARQIMAYIVGHSQDGTAKDVTVRYLKRQTMPGRTKGARLPPEKVPVYGRNGKVKRYEQFDWFKSAISAYRRGTRKYPVTEIDEAEDSTDLTPAKPEKKPVKEGEETLQYYKQSKEFVLQRHLRREEALKPGAKPVKLFKNKAKGGKIEEEDVYLRADVLNVKSAETWHKQGRAPLPGERPLKMVPYRAATTNRRRELLEAEAATGQKVLQGLFSQDQTEWIIPPPIENGVIPKNSYGNIDLFAEHMCPEGAIHIPFRGAVKVCKRLQIDYAEAVVDFEFGNRMAVPVINGVVVAEEYHDQVLEELEKDEAERARKEDEKRRKATLGRWRKFIMGMRIVERIRQDYGEIGDDVAVFGHSKHNPLKDEPVEKKDEDEDMAGGFLPAGYVEEEEEDDKAKKAASSFFAVTNDDDDEETHEDNLVMEDHRLEPPAAVIASPSINSKSKSPTPPAKEEIVSEEPPSTKRKRGRPSLASKQNDNTPSTNGTKKATPKKRPGRPAKSKRKSPTPEEEEEDGVDEETDGDEDEDMDDVGEDEEEYTPNKIRPVNQAATRHSARQTRQRMIIDDSEEGDEESVHWE